MKPAVFGTKSNTVGDEPEDTRDKVPNNRLSARLGIAAKNDNGERQKLEDAAAKTLSHTSADINSSNATKDPADNQVFIEILEKQLSAKFASPELAAQDTEHLNGEAHRAVDTFVKQTAIDIGDGERIDLVTFALNYFIEKADVEREKYGDVKDVPKYDSSDLNKTKDHIQPLLLEHIDVSAASALPRDILADQVGDVVGELLVQEKINLNLLEQRDLVTILLDDMLGLGPLEPLLKDDEVTDIMVNGPNQIYVEKHGKLVLTDVKFKDNKSLINVAQRIVSAIGRRVDESSPICDARLEDGSRVNVIIPPLAIDGASISIRKFAKQKITLDKMVAQENLSQQMSDVLKIAAACRLNVLISGGTGSGKTTMLNAMSQLIDEGERVVTIEDAAELQMQQPHVVRLETRPPNLEGQGEVTMRDLVKNALRMRPDRIILGEIRGAEAVDMLQAMNTGHDGSLGTIHANRPREALTRLENMIGLAGINLPTKALRTQICDALDMVVQVARMRDGKRRVQYVTEIVGIEGDVITTQNLFTYQFTGENEAGELVGNFVPASVRPNFLTKAEYYGLGRALMSAMEG